MPAEATDRPPRHGPTFRQTRLAKVVESGFITAGATALTAGRGAGCARSGRVLTNVNRGSRERAGRVIGSGEVGGTTKT